MTDERLNELLYNITHTWSANAAEEIRAHIAALTAESKARLANSEMWKAYSDRVDKDRDALRERLAAAEEDVQDKRALAHKWEESSKGLRERVRAMKEQILDLGARIDRTEPYALMLESRLAAIRRRAGDTDSLHAAFRSGEHDAESITAVARYILGDDAPETDEATPITHETVAAVRKAVWLPPLSELEGLQEDGLRPIPGFPMPPPSVRDVIRADSTETTSADAFATVRDGINAAESSLGTSAKTERRRIGHVALSLLERRMGAQNAALRYALTIHLRMPDDVIARIQSALTDAPEVYTREEIRAVLKSYLHHRPLTDALRDLAALRRKP